MTYKQGVCIYDTAHYITLNLSLCENDRHAQILLLYYLNLNSNTF